MTTHSFSKFIYCDTNILSHLAKQRARWAWFAEYLLERDLTLAIGSQVAELADVQRLHQSLAQMFLSLPTGIVKSWDVVLAEEVAAHPNERRDTLLAYPINALLLESDGVEQIEAFLSSGALAEARQGQHRSAEQMAARHAELKPNFAPGPAGKCTRAQAAEFAWIQALQWLSTTHLDFLQQLQSDVASFNAATFRSARLFALGSVLQVLPWRPRSTAAFGFRGSVALLRDPILRRNNSRARPC